MSGWMHKRKELDNWKHRFVVMTPDALCYYVNRGDEKPLKRLTLKSTSVKRSGQKPFAFEMHSVQLLAETKDGRMHFACADQESLFEWLAAFRETQALVQSYAIADGMAVANLELRRVACAARDKAGRTPAHAAAAHAEAVAARLRRDAINASQIFVMSEEPCPSTRARRKPRRRRASATAATVGLAGPGQV